MGTLNSFAKCDSCTGGPRFFLLFTAFCIRMLCGARDEERIMSWLWLSKLFDQSQRSESSLVVQQSFLAFHFTTKKGCEAKGLTLWIIKAVFHCNESWLNIEKLILRHASVVFFCLRHRFVNSWFIIQFSFNYIAPKHNSSRLKKLYIVRWRSNNNTEKH